MRMRWLIVAAFFWHGRCSNAGLGQRGWDDAEAASQGRSHPVATRHVAAPGRQSAKHHHKEIRTTGLATGQASQKHRAGHSTEAHESRSGHAAHRRHVEILQPVLDQEARSTQKDAAAQVVAPRERARARRSALAANSALRRRKGGLSARQHAHHQVTEVHSSRQEHAGAHKTAAAHHPGERQRTGRLTLHEGRRSGSKRRLEARHLQVSHNLTSHRQQDAATAPMPVQHQSTTSSHGPLTPPHKAAQRLTASHGTASVLQHEHGSLKTSVQRQSSNSHGQKLLAQQDADITELDEALSRLPAKVGIMYAELHHAAGDTTAAAVVDELNAIYAHALGVKDEQELACRSGLPASQLDVEAARVQLDLADAQLSAKHQRIQALQIQVDRALANIEALRSEFDQHQKECEAYRESAAQQLNLLAEDTPSLSSLVEQVTSSCSGAAATAPLIEACTLPDGKYFTRFSDPNLHSMVLEFSNATQLLTSEHLDRALKNSLSAPPSFLQVQAAASSRRFRGASNASTDTHGSQHQRTAKRAVVAAMRAAFGNSVGEKSASNVSTETHGLQQQHNVKHAAVDAVRAALGNTLSDDSSCVVGPEVPCETLTDIISGLPAGADDLSDSIKRGAQVRADRCRQNMAGYENRIDRLRQSATDASVALSMQVADMNQASTLQRDRSSSYKAVQETTRNQQEQCQERVRQAETMMHEAKTVKTYLQDTDVLFLGDCEVSEWAASPCSTFCGGGTQNLTRRVVSAPEEHTCPALAMTRPCNTHPCPVNGELGPWREWSECSARCGGGTRTRTRDIKASENGGRPVAETLQQEVCNLNPCDQDCVLSNWTAWSNCSKACLHGHSFRTRGVLQQAFGDGTCPEEMSSTRLESVSCNTDVCNKDQPLCASRVDLVLLLDVSGSVGEDGISASQHFVESLLTRLLQQDEQGEPLTQVAIVEFASDARLLQGLSAEPSALNDAVSALTWQRTQTNTAQALAVARSHLAEHGRMGTPGAVLVVTDGMPVSSSVVDGVVKDLRDCGNRVSFLSVGLAFDWSRLQGWASWPPEENVVNASGYNDLNEGIVNNVVANLCIDLA